MQLERISPKKATIKDPSVRRHRSSKKRPMPLSPSLLSLTSSLSSSVASSFEECVKSLAEGPWAADGMGYGEKEMARAVKRLAKVRDVEADPFFVQVVVNVCLCAEGGVVCLDPLIGRLNTSDKRY